MVATKQITLQDFLKKFPKVDIHYHLLGGVRLETMLALAKKYKVNLTESEAKSYYRKYQHQAKEVKGGIAALNFLYPLLRSPEDYYRVAYEVAEDAANTGIKHLELFWNPSDTSLNYNDITSALASAFEAAKQKWGISALFIPSINREKSPEEAVEMVETIIANPHPLVPGIGIDYKEDLHPIEKFWKAYKLAKTHNLRLTGHCSEFGLHWRNVETGLDLIHLERIDHGYTVINNPELSARCAREHIPFTVVPSNTFYLKQWPIYEEWKRNHPIKEMARLGLTLVPATDDWHMHGTDGAECYRVMIEDFGFDLDAIKQMMINGINASWVKESTKTIWRDTWSNEFDQLRASLDKEPEIPKDVHTPYFIK